MIECRNHRNSGYRKSPIATAAGLLLLSCGIVVADPGETKQALETRYTEVNKERRSEPIVAPASEMIEFNLAPDSGWKYVRVWLKDGKSIMESHVARRGFADYEVDSLLDRNVGKSEWLPVPAGKDLITQRNKIWLRKDRSVAVLVVRTPTPTGTTMVWLTTSLTLGYVDALKALVIKSDSVGNAVATRELWTSLEKFLDNKSGGKDPHAQ